MLLITFVILLAASTNIFVNSLYKKCSECTTCPGFRHFTVNVTTATTLGTVDERFLSIALDCNLICNNWVTSNCNINISSPRFITLVSELSPGVLKVGGHACNFMTFEKNQPHGNCDVNQSSCPLNDASNRFIMNETDWKQLNELALSSGVNFLCMLNPWDRIQGEVDLTKSEELFNISVARNYTNNQMFSIGNEDNSDSFRFGSGCSISGANLSADIQILQNVLSNSLYAPYYGNTELTGPDVTQNQISAPILLTDYLNGPAGNLVDAVTFHYFSNWISLSDFTSPAMFDAFKITIDLMKTAVYSGSMGNMPSTTPIWVTASNSALGGGISNITNRFVAAFSWADKCGMAARWGMKLITYHAFIDKDYPMVYCDPSNNTFVPLPTYWWSVIYKLTVFTTLFEVARDPPSGRFRGYAHCANPKFSGYKSGAVTYFGMNMYDKNMTLDISHTFPMQTVYVYILTSDDLQSEYIYLNGNILSLNAAGTLPALEPCKLTSTDKLELPPYSLFFYVFPKANVTACHTP